MKNEAKCIRILKLWQVNCLKTKPKKFTLQNSENIKSIPNPLEEKIKTFEKKVEDSQKENISIHSALKEQLHGLKDLNQQMSLKHKISPKHSRVIVKLKVIGEK